MGRERLDAVLVRRGLVRSRTQAAQLITSGKVTVTGQIARKAAMSVAMDADLAVDVGDDWASRGAYKLIGALDAFVIDVAERRIVDLGASTGGFVDVVMRRGAARVAAIDVGHGQLAPHLASDRRVLVCDGVNARDLSAGDIDRITTELGGFAHLVLADLSFISLRHVLPVMAAFADDGADLLPMVKPQFEVGKGRLGSGGVVRQPQLRAEAMTVVAESAATLDWGVADIAPSPLPGPSGNIEYFLRLRRDVPVDQNRTEMLIRAAIESGLS